MDACDGHIDLVLTWDAKGRKQPVPARRLPDGNYLILYSPGLVEGIAADDIIRLTDEKKGSFEVVRRGGNVSIQVYRLDGIRPVAEWLATQLVPLGGRLDGSVEKGAVFTVPVSSGFGAIEKVLSQATKTFDGLEWNYGNVYAQDGTTPLNWWQSR